MAAHIKKYTGLKFNHLTLLQFSRGRGGGKPALWMARCDCGTIVEVIGKEVERGGRKTCGKCQLSRDLKSSKRNEDGGKGLSLRAAERKLYSNYIRAALKRGYNWDLTPEQVFDLMGKNCVYCNVPPLQKVKRSKKLYNGLDRVDNSKGYTHDNIVTCCGSCNRMKGTLSAQEFLNKIRIIASHLKIAPDIS